MSFFSRTYRRFTWNTSRTIIILYAILLSLVIFTFIPRPGGNVLNKISLNVPSRTRRYHRHGAIASESDVCSNIGKNFLLMGGNAADALIGTAFCLGVVAMYHVGIGGGGFMLIRSGNGALESIEFKERSPAAAFENMYAGNKQGQWLGGLAVGVPGELRGLELLHQRYATLPWSQLVEPAISLARDGFRVNEDLAFYINKPNQTFLRDDPSWAVDFAPNGTLKKLGDIMTRPRYADTLEYISKNGVNDFYDGTIAASSIKALQAANGSMTIQDLKQYKANVVDPIQITYRDFVIIGDDLPAGGTQVLSVMKTIEGFEKMGDPGAVNLSTHRFVEATRFSWGERTRLGDPLFNDTIRPFARNMISEEAAIRRRNLISDTNTLDPSVYNPDGFGNAKTGGTSSMVATDEDGLVIAWTSTVNDWWGSHICVPETGIILNNIMGDFTTPDGTDLWGLPSSPTNYIKGGKRPQDSVANIIVEHAQNRSFYFATGCAGGAHIVTTDLQMLWHVLDGGQTLHEAINQPRLHDQLHPDQTDFDWTYDNTTVAFMKSLGHNVTHVAPGGSRPHSAMRRWDGSFEAVTEPTLFNGGAVVT